MLSMGNARSRLWASVRLVLFRISFKLGLYMARNVFQSSQVVLDTAPYFSSCTAEILLRLSGSSKIEFDSNCSTANEIIVNKTKPSNYFLHLITLLIWQAERMAFEIKLKRIEAKRCLWKTLRKNSCSADNGHLRLDLICSVCSPDSDGQKTL